MASIEAIERIHSVNSEARILVCLRHPIARAYSRYQDILRDSPEKLNGESFEVAITRSIEKDYHYTRFGRYYEQLEGLFRFFRREQVCVMIQERMLKRLEAEMARVFAFLKVSPFTGDFRVVHSGNYQFRCSQEIFERLLDYYRVPNQRLFELLGEPVPEWEEWEREISVQTGPNQPLSSMPERSGRVR